MYKTQFNYDGKPFFSSTSFNSTYKQKSNINYMINCNCNYNYNCFKNNNNYDIYSYTQGKPQSKSLLHFLKNDQSKELLANNYLGNFQKKILNMNAQLPNINKYNSMKFTHTNDFKKEIKKNGINQVFLNLRDSAEMKKSSKINNDFNLKKSSSYKNLTDLKSRNKKKFVSFVSLASKDPKSNYLVQNLAVTFNNNFINNKLIKSNSILRLGKY